MECVFMAQVGNLRYGGNLVVGSEICLVHESHPIEAGAPLISHPLRFRGSAD